MPAPEYSAEDSQLVSDLIQLSKNPKLCKSSVYATPAEPNTLISSWKLNEFKYYDIPSPFPTLARGLFTTELERGSKDKGNPPKHRIVVRGYDKFFNIGEVPWTTWEALETHTAPPYTLSLKSNGCIIFIAALTPEKLIITSKHSLGPLPGLPLSHAQAGEQWLRRYLEEKGRTEQDFAKRLWDENWTAIAELCDDSFEEHVLAYPPERTGLHLHGLNVATKDFKTMPHEIVDSFAEEWGFIKTRTHIVSSIAEVKEFTDHISNVGEWDGEAVEGFVVRTHVTDPPTEGRGFAVVSKRQSPYSPGSSFFFKVKFDEPYMMYRDWREVTKKLLSTKGPMNASILPKGKMKRKETKVYVKWVIAEINKNKKAFEGYTKGHGIIATRERFLKWYKEQQEGALEGQGGEELARLEADNEGELDFNSTGANEGEAGKVIIMPIAIPGSGKTSIAAVLTRLFGFGHTQSDDIKAKKSAPTFIKNVTKLLYKNDVVIADKNNHLKQHRTQLREAANKFKPRARLVALNWSLANIPPASAQQICSERIVSRGLNHQTLIPGAIKGSSHVKSHDDVLWMFISNYEELSSNEADVVIDMDIEDDLETMVSCVVDGLFNSRMLTGPGGVLEGEEKPDVGRIKEVVNDVLENYQVEGSEVKAKVVVEKESKKVEAKKSKPPRYYGVLPELDLEVVLDGVFGDVSVDEEGMRGKAKEFWEQLKKGKRVTEKPHITIVHQKQLPEDQDVWEKCASVTGIPNRQAPKFDCTITRALWDGERVMALVVDDLHLDLSVLEDVGDDSVEALGIQAGRKFLKVMSEETRDRLHVTVGTANAKVMPVEGKMLVERWRAGEREGEGVYEIEFAEKMVVKGKLARLYS